MNNLYTIIYSWMVSELGLRGIAKEVFALIFGFWLRAGQKPVRASLTTLQELTGATRPTVTKAISSLLADNLISAEKHPGRPTMYIVRIDADLLGQFNDTFRPCKQVNWQEKKSLTTTGRGYIPVNKRKEKNKIDMTLRVLTNDKINTGGLPDAK